MFRHIYISFQGKKNLAKMHKAYVGFTSLWKKKQGKILPPGEPGIKTEKVVSCNQQRKKKEMQK